MKTFLIVNPSSSSGATGRHYDAISSAVRGAVGDHAHAFTERALHATELTRKALADGHDLVIAVGGDGTINEVVNGFFAEPVPGAPSRPLRPGAALGIVPRGTGGDLRRTIGLESDLASCCARLKNGQRSVDVGRVDYTRADGSPASRHFINVADVGVGAHIVDIANRSSKVLGGKLSFIIASLRGLSGWRDVAVRTSYDGGAFEELEVTTLAIANGRFFGGGMMVAPEARLEDGLFHITQWSGFTMTDFILKSGSMYDGTHVKLKGTRTRTARSIVLEAGKGARGPVLVEVDGEQIGQLPATFTVMPQALQLVS